MKRILSAALCAALLLTALAGCAGSGEAQEDPERSALCLVVDNTANSQGIDFDNIRDTLYNAARNEGYVSIVSVDGSPSIVFHQDYEREARFKDANPTRLDLDAEADTDALLNTLKAVAPDDPETDYLASLQLAARSLSSMEEYDSRTILLMGSGLSTSGQLDFNRNLLYGEPDLIAQLLETKGEVPDFTGIHVFFQNIGDVAAPQQTLSAAQVNRLKDIYAAIVEAGGGTSKIDNKGPVDAPDRSGYPTVTPVSLPTDTPISFDPEEAPSLDDGPIRLGEDTVAFIGDTAQYKCPETAMESLTKIASMLEGNDTRVLLCGCTAGDVDSSKTMALSEERAEAVKQSLIELGVDAGRIYTLGLGCSDPWHLEGVGYEGEAAQLNRKVMMLDASSESARNLMV